MTHRGGVTGSTGVEGLLAGTWAGRTPASVQAEDPQATWRVAEILRRAVFSCRIRPPLTPRRLLLEKV
jgi:hypothetical protein